MLNRKITLYARKKSLDLKLEKNTSLIIVKKIAQKIGDREATIEIGIADHFLNGDRDLNFVDRVHALCINI